MATLHVPYVDVPLCAVSTLIPVPRLNAAFVINSLFEAASVPLGNPSSYTVPVVSVGLTVTFATSIVNVVVARSPSPSSTVYVNTSCASAVTAFAVDT